MICIVAAKRNAGSGRILTRQYHELTSPYAKVQAALSLPLKINYFIVTSRHAYSKYWSEIDLYCYL